MLQNVLSARSGILSATPKRLVVSTIWVVLLVALTAIPALAECGPGMCTCPGC